MNDILRLALVMNTNHSKFIDNLSNIIIFILFEYKNNDKGLELTQIQEKIEEKTGLIFESKEILQAIKDAIKKDFVNVVKTGYVIGQNGYKRVHSENGNEFDEILNLYVKEFSIEGHDKSTVFKLICGFLYKRLNENISIFTDLIGLNSDMITGEAKSRIYASEQDEYIESDIKIINDFIDWENTQKNKMLFQLVSFGFDYCRLTIRKDQRSFKNLFDGKVFYLDSNIIFRLMGINNENRMKTTEAFIHKCKEVGICLAYTNYTKQEVLDSLSYHVDKLKNLLSGIHASPDKLLKLFTKEYDSELYAMYHNWSRKGGNFKEIEMFKSYLKDEFYKCVRDFKLINFEDQSFVIKDKYEAYTKSLASAKNYPLDDKRIVTVQTDVQNLLGVSRIRLRYQDGKAWTVKDYIISADHTYIKWAGEIYRGQTPYIILPSVWYSLILKLDGRTDDDFKSFVEFMKIRYSQGNGNNTAHEIIFNISKITSEGLLQDKIIDEIVDGNIRNLNGNEYEDIPALVRQSYDSVLEKTRDAGYNEGQAIGKEQGIELGFQKGIEASQDEVFAKGEEIGLLKGKLQEINSSIVEKAKSIQIRNIVISVIEAVALVVVAIFICKYVWCDLPDEKVEKFNTIIVIGGIVVAALGTIVTTIWLPVNLEKITEKIKKKRKAEIKELETKISNQKVNNA